MKRLCLLLLGLIPLICSYAEWQPGQWRFLKHYDSRHLYRIALPLGGIGTGTVSLSGRGELRDWEIMNVPALGYSTVTTGNLAPFFAIFVQPEGLKPSVRMLAGPLEKWEYMSQEGQPVDSYGLPRFDEASFDGCYPYGQVNLKDKTMPVTVRIKGFNPFIPCDAEASGLPVAAITYEVTNITDRTETVSVCGSIRNFIGRDGSRRTENWKGQSVPVGAKKNRNTFRSEKGISGIYFTSDGVDHSDPAWGTMALTTESTEGISWRTSSVADVWSKALLNTWGDFSGDGTLSPCPDSGEDDPMASLAVKHTLKPHETRCFTFFLTWHFPNRKAWSQTVVGNYYCQKFTDAWDAAMKVIPKMSELENRTCRFVNTFLSSSYPMEVKEAALFNLSTLRSQTVFRLPDGHLMGWEGVMDHVGSCYGSCTHVWNYETATAFLFGDLAKSMRDVEFNFATNDDGRMSFRVGLPLETNGHASAGTAADGQLGTLMKLYRDWQLSGDKEMLRRLWPKARKAMEYAWTKGSWDADADGVMEGAQGNTMDVAYYGPNPQMQFWYMGALRCTALMAVAMGDKPFARKCEQVYRKASAFTDKVLFNGEYYEHHITDPHTHEFVDMGNPKADTIDFQLGRGCLVDQLVGQYMADICGLGDLCKKENLVTTLKSIMRYNFKDDFSSHFNNMRSYVLGHESGLLMASWPKGRLRYPFPYFSESMTGFEYVAAIGMIQHGLRDDGLKCIRAIRDRFDGVRRNPYDEIECGHHYARAMASWSAIPALSGFHYSAVTQTLHVTSEPGIYFFSTGHVWGSITVNAEGKPKVNVVEGKLPLKHVVTAR